MLTFHSGRVRSVNSKRGVAECMETAFPAGINPDCRVVMVQTTLGHKLDQVANAIRHYAPNAMIVGNSCCGVVGREGVGESMNEIALMAVCGPKEECTVKTVQGIYGDNAYEKGRELARSLHEESPKTRSAYLLCPGIDIANDRVIKAFDEVFAGKLTLFGGTSSDNMRGLINLQYNGSEVAEHNAWVVGFSDPTLKVVTRSAHGFSPHDSPLVATKVRGNKIIEFNGKPAWQEYTARCGLSSNATCGDTITIGALAEKLPPDLSDASANGYILRVVTKVDPDGTMHYPVTCPAGRELWLTTRDEGLIFSVQQQVLDEMKDVIGSGELAAVFQTDCLARGRFLFNKIMKDEIIAMMQNALSASYGTPPWLGMYGFGEYAKLKDRNYFHNYSTSLAALYRD